jgi:hypothetical protein
MGLGQHVLAVLNPHVAVGVSPPLIGDHTLWVAKTSSAHEIVNLQRLAAELLPPVFRALAQSNAV